MLSRKFFLLFVILAVLSVFLINGNGFSYSFAGDFKGIIPDSQWRLLTESDLKGLSEWELNIARNEIYARHGRIFSKAEYAEYFKEQWWYKEDPNYSDSCLSDIEISNAAFIKNYQENFMIGLIPDSQWRLLTQIDLKGLSAWELNIARNEIYARHGRIFSKAEYKEYFNSQPWYDENPNYTDSMLSEIEIENVNFIKQYQDKTGLK